MKKRAVSFMLAILLLLSLTPRAGAASSSAFGSASALYTLGLFKGTGTNSDGTPIYELDRAPTRAEAAVMLVRMLGKENEAKQSGHGHPFKDVEDWARPYVGYAYSSGLSNGTSETSYGSSETISASQFITLVLRALGYSSGSDFSWDKSYLFSDSIGLTDGSYNAGSAFTRGDAAIVLYAALSQKLKGSSRTLLGSLYDNGSVSEEAVKSVGLERLLESSSGPASELSAEQIYAKCAPAVFYIEVYDSAGKLINIGSGFFINSSGTAVTNYHVIDKAHSASVKTVDGKTYNVLGLYGTDEANDLAILKIDGSDFRYLETANSDAVKTGATVYAIGNPKGLESTISQGIVSYINRKIGNMTFIQTTAPFSSGSSGGALIDTYGRAIGVTTLTTSSGQNLNLAIPINMIKALPQSSVSPFETGGSDSGPAGSETPYARCSSVPDFGAFIGVPLFSSSSKTGDDYVAYYYNYKYSATMAVNANALSDYCNLLKKWGFKFSESYTSSTSTLSGNIYKKGGIEVMVATQTSESGTRYVCIYLILEKASAASYPKKETPYAENAAVPDFGAYFGVDVSYDNSTKGSASFLYKKSAVDAVSTSALTEYVSVLKKWGFKFSENYTSQFGSGTRFTNGSLTISVFGFKIDGANCIGISFSKDASSGSVSYPKTESGYYYDSLAPDFGAYFGVNIFNDLSNGNVYSLIYRVSDLPVSPADAVSEYVELLKKWGFSYQNRSDSYGDYYAKGSHFVVVGAGTYDGVTSIRITMVRSSRGYSFYTSVPDFGYYFGVESVYKSVGYTSAYLYYSVSEVDAADPKALETYYSLLESKGFKYVSEYAPTSLSHGKCYSNGKALVYAGLLVENSMTVYFVKIAPSS